MDNWKEEQQIVVENIKKLRKDFKYSQKDIAKSLNISLYRYRKIEKNEVELKYSEILLLSKLFFVDLTDFFKETCKPSVFIMCGLKDIEEYDI